MISISPKTKYTIKFSNTFKKDLKKAIKQGKDIDKLLYVVKQLANKEILSSRYRNHNLINNKKYKNCGECHIEPDWILVYKYIENNLILMLVNIGSHSNLFKKGRK